MNLKVKKWSLNKIPLVFFKVFLLMLARNHAFASGSKSQKLLRMDAPGGVMEKSPIKDQKGVPLCFAYSAVQLLDSYKLKLQLETNPSRHDKVDMTKLTETSALAAAVDSAYDSNLSYIESLNYGGFVCETINSMIKHGTCSEQKTAELFKSIKAKGNLTPSQLKELFGIAYNGKVYRSDVVEKLFVQLNRALTPQEQMKVFKFIVDKACENDRTKIDDLKIKCVETRRLHRGEDSANHLFKILNDKISHQSNMQPVSIKYCSNFYEVGPTYNPIMGYRPGTKEIIWKQDCLIHYSVVIGKKISQDHHQKEKTSYLIRDSYGKNCGGHSLHPHFKCENGQIWVDEEVLKPNLLEVNYLEKEELI
jgi:hypothetical protein